MRIYDFLTGFYRLTPAPEDRLALRNLCLAKHITLLSDGEESFRVRAWDGKYLSRVARENGVPLTLGGIRGLPRILWKYRRRAGFAVGLALAVLLCAAALGPRMIVGL